MADKYIQRKAYPSDATDEEWAFCAPYLPLMKEDVPQRTYPLRVLFNGLRYMVRAGCAWRMLPHDLPPWQAIQQQTLRWIAAGVFHDMAADLRRIQRLLLERAEEPSAVILDGRTVQSTPESGARAGYDGHKRRKGSKVQIAVDTLGHLLALRVTSANDPHQRGARGPGRSRLVVAWSCDCALRSLDARPAGTARPSRPHAIAAHRQRARHRCGGARRDRSVASERPLVSPIPAAKREYIHDLRGPW